MLGNVIIQAQGDHLMSGVSAAQIEVAQFVQIHHLPLVWQGDTDFFDIEKERKSLIKSGWKGIDDPLSALSEEKTAHDNDVFNEVVYFYDFARKFLYPRGSPDDDCAFYLFHRENPGSVQAQFSNVRGEQTFLIKRLHLHLFRTGTIIITVETEHDGKTELSLADVQTIIDHFRRSYTPYWDGCAPQGIPLSLTLSTGAAAENQLQDQTVDFLYKNRENGADAPLLEPWKSWCEPLCQSQWRDPSDERVPAMSYIALKQTEATPRDTMNRIKTGDWFRLAEADSAGETEFPYNPKFLAPKARDFFYDRFFPHDNIWEGFATRHIFGGEHYAMVVVDGDFTRQILFQHFRRHYEKLALVARFEQVSLLGYSFRLTQLVKQLNDRPEGRKLDGKSEGRKKFRNEVRDLHENFLEFTHRFRFTGITSQIQGREMFAKWRQSLSLDLLYVDVKNEVASAAQFSLDSGANERADRGNDLSKIAFWAAVILAAPGLKDFGIVEYAVTFVSAWMSATPDGVLDGVIEFVVSVGLVGAVAGLLWQFLKKRYGWPK